LDPDSKTFSGNILFLPSVYHPRHITLPTTRTARVAVSARPEVPDILQEGNRAPRLAPPAAAPTAKGDDSDSGDDFMFDDHGFDHPSTYAEQPWIWIPKDDLGLSEVLVAELKASRVEASNEGSSIDHKGTVDVSRKPAR